MLATLPLLEQTDFPALRRGPLQTLQINLGYKCNQQCLHCHVNAGPNRQEMMSSETIDAVLAVLRRAPAIAKVDITGGAPELHPEFRRLVQAVRALNRQVMDRCNLTILSEPGQEDLADFLAAQQAEVVASLPCYLEGNVDRQRGKGVFQHSIDGLRQLNAVGYGDPSTQLQLNLVYNPQGPSLPPPQQTLEQDYKRHLLDEYGIRFNRLFTLANMPIQRFGSTLISKGQFIPYMQLLKSAYQAGNLDAVMCRQLVSVDWRGYLYDCDFNQMLGLPLRLDGKPLVHVKDLDPAQLQDNAIVVKDHCYGCTAGQGSSCGGALS
jgi:radical SAM/Cys-rich protein